ncbi:MAG: TIGR04282 family arsenosugar biosynthesis glycosyltransferase [Bacteroidetes bacterium]|nr:TIGR04282 family arsenosugar biosynthesis glycosyltransferase [Bacteroidota bacterium]
MQQAIIIFVRHPELGKVKTRLAREIGDDKALEVYKKLLQLTHDTVIECRADKYVYYADRIRLDDLWEEDYFIKRSQQGEDLGERMHHAFTDVFGKGYGKVLIIGSDCPGITPKFLENTFMHLDSYDVVIGPAADGGYYLLGLKEPDLLYFQNKEWSSASVLDATVRDIRKSGSSYCLLPVLNDVDTLHDLLQWESQSAAD